MHTMITYIIHNRRDIFGQPLTFFEVKQLHLEFKVLFLQRIEHLFDFSQRQTTRRQWHIVQYTPVSIARCRRIISRRLRLSRFKRSLRHRFDNKSKWLQPFAFASVPQLTYKVFLHSFHNFVVAVEQTATQSERTVICPCCIQIKESR
jgi:hypothetical protein